MSMSSWRSHLLACLIVVLSPLVFNAAAADAAQDAGNAMRLFRVAPGLKVDLFAQKPNAGHSAFVSVRTRSEAFARCFDEGRNGDGKSQMEKPDSNGLSICTVLH